MKKQLLIVAAAMTLVACNKSGKNSGANSPLVTSEDSLSYAFGVNIGNSLKEQEFNVNPQIMLQAVEAVLEGKDLSFDQMEAISIIQGYMGRAQMVENEKFKNAGQAFLDENAKRQGVIATPSGLQYEIIKLGDGQKPTLDNVVKVHYHGSTTDGVVFDSSVQRGEPISFPLNGVIPGWQEGLQLMPVGSKFKFYIPYDLAYGEHGAGDVIGPYSTLIFEVELLEIEN
jgi:FKBP-type peptidyl-prolyl cis-trans isomerase FklB